MSNQSNMPIGDYTRKGLCPYCKSELREMKKYTNGNLTRGKCIRCKNEFIVSLKNLKGGIK